MKINKLFLGLFACAALSACSNDESEIIPNDDPKVFTGDEAYITVRLADAGSITRATGGDFEYGTDEQAVTNAHFYFYDANGVFVVQGNAWNGGNPSTENPPGNIEFTSNTLVVLKGLTEKAYPKYMVTVLNKPQNFVHGTTLTAMKAALADNASEGIINNDNGTNYFAMSTTSFAGQAGLEDNYFVTEIKEENFSLEPITGTFANPVTIYVERLAAKVSLGLHKDLEAVTINGKDYYQIKATVAGDPNAGGNGNIAAENLYVELLGWKLNATAKKSYIVKNINKDWTNTDLGFIWNVPSFYRSYWGQSFNYGQSSGYPANAAEAAASEWLEYVSLKDDIVEMGKAAYCAENTNMSYIISQNFPSAVTSILLKARICDEKGEALDLVRYNGLLFNQDSFLEYVLNVLNTSNQLNVWYATDNGSGVTTFTRIGKEYVEMENVADGVVKVVFKNPNNTTLYSQRAGNVFDKITDFTALNTSLANASAGALGYKGGLMYYNIPIEHLNNADITNGEIPEAKYGVVRNHRYVVTINKLENMGKGIYDEDEVIVPGDDDGETYFVGANINILSWKIVNQDVDL